MNDLISREVAIDALMAWEEDSVWDDECLKHRGESGWVAPSDVIEQLPSAQPEIIRCKDCKDYQTDWETSYPNRHYCATMDSTMPEDGFCSYAERRTDD